MLAELGKILIAGLAGAGAVGLGVFFEELLIQIPGLAVEIPLFGSIANILGVFLGDIVSGIIGAIALHIIDRFLAKKRKQELTERTIDKQNEVLVVQRELRDVSFENYKAQKEETYERIRYRHKVLEDFIVENKDSLIPKKSPKRKHIENDLDKEFEELDKLLDF